MTRMWLRQGLIWSGKGSGYGYRNQARQQLSESVHYEKDALLDSRSANCTSAVHTFALVTEHHFWTGFCSDSSFCQQRHSAQRCQRPKFKAHGARQQHPRATPCSGTNLQAHRTSAQAPKCIRSHIPSAHTPCSGTSAQADKRTQQRHPAAAPAPKLPSAHSSDTLQRQARKCTCSSSYTWSKNPNSSRYLGKAELYIYMYT